jgi:hypothetical protein
MTANSGSAALISENIEYREERELPRDQVRGCLEIRIQPIG